MPGPALQGPLLAAVEAGPAGPRVRVLARLGPGGEAALRRAGGTIGARAGDVVTARVPLEAVPRLLAGGAIHAMEAATALRPLTAAVPPAPAAGLAAASRTAAPPLLLDNDSAAADAGFDALRRQVGDGWEGLAGQGVIVGVYDSGLDLTHPDFHHPDGSTRVLYAWDQRVAGTPPGPLGDHHFDYGAECTAGAIDGDECPMVDIIGHGTHVAGTAAGDGSATGAGLPAFRFPGGAPAADLIVVKGGDGAYTADRLVDGVAYIFERAAALGRPAVVNLSISSQSGPHDGSMLLEEALDALSGPGRIVVAGAGNAGNHLNTFPFFDNGSSHAEGRSGRGAHGVRVPPYAPAPGVGNDGVILELWYDGADSLAITIRSPGGAALTVATGDSASLLTPGGTAAILNAVDGPDPRNGDHGALLALLDAEAGAPPDSGLWAIEVDPVALHGSGRYHLWLVGAALDTPELTSLEGGTTNRVLVGVPASADRVIAAGAHVTRHQWLGPDGEPEEFPIQESLGDIAFFSSPGPRRDGVPKPELTAPGKVLVSSRSKDATLWGLSPVLAAMVEADSVHAGLMGTSMSSPQVAGAVAVLLQIEPRLTPEEAADLLRLGARTDAFVPPVVPDPAWGAGKLDIAAAARRLRPDGLAADGEPLALSANPVRGDALVLSYPERPRSLAVYTVVGERVRSFSDAELGPLTTVWPLDTDAGGAVANGVYVLVAELPGRRVLRKLFVARP